MGSGSVIREKTTMMSRQISLGRAARRIAVVALALGLFVAPATAAANPTIPGSTTGPNGLVYLPMYGEGSVIAVDPVANKVVRTYPGIGDHPLVLKMSLDQKKVFVGNFGPVGWSVAVIHVDTGVVTQIPTLGPAWAVSQLSHDGRYFYVPTALSVTQVIDTQTEKVVRTLPILVPPIPAHLEVSNDDKTLYVMSGPGTVTGYDTVTGAVTKPPLFLNGAVSAWGALNARGDKLYAVNYLSGITVVDTTTWSVDRTTFFEPLAGAISATLTPDGKQLWVCGVGDGQIRVLDAETGHTERIFKDPTGAVIYAGFSPDSKTAYLSSLGPWTSNIPDLLQALKFGAAFFSGTIGTKGSFDQYDTTTFQMKKSLPLDGTPIAGAYPG
ncbi:YncE family protein [Antrihabitans cavernicola]|uniref:YncE family protein n=1 Tax=Antrihabitans cavernicola TaxID=2495913 RepID=A0A5A7SFQ0_9NOCA|nr:hypothetical protein [Spelaeibacter cavernicola]KAA0024404.1 hypothetical protein FOY51_00060 [Spelaeibacter cavernicola]